MLSSMHELKKLEFESCFDSSVIWTTFSWLWFSALCNTYVKRIMSPSRLKCINRTKHRFSFRIHKVIWFLSLVWMLWTPRGWSPFCRVNVFTLWCMWLHKYVFEIWNLEHATLNTKGFCNRQDWITWLPLNCGTTGPSTEQFWQRR